MEYISATILLLLAGGGFVTAIRLHTKDIKQPKDHGNYYQRLNRNNRGLDRM
jgi:hypothetical protein